MPKYRKLKASIAVTMAFGGSLASTAAVAAEPPVNTGNTSFMDGFGDPTGYGVTYMNYLSWFTSKSIKDSSGNDVPIFRNPRFNAIVDLNQFIYSFKVPESFVAQPGLDLIVPLVNVSASFAAGGPALSDNGFGVGDLTFGPFLQFKPIKVDHRPIFSHRFEFDFFLPVGKYDPNKEINPGSHAWAINPYWAATLLPLPQLEITTRFNFLYNFKNSDPIVTPVGKPTSTQEGPAIFDDFAVAYEILPHDEARAGAHSVRVGLNGYYFKQIGQNKVNGTSETNSEEQTLGLGPGAMWVAGHEDAFWLNAYFETAVKNRFAGDLFQIRWAHSFADF